MDSPLVNTKYNGRSVEVPLTDLEVTQPVDDRYLVKPYSTLPKFGVFVFVGE